MKKVLSLIIVFLFVFSAIPAMAKDDAPDLDHEIVVPIGQMVIIGDAHLTGYMDQIEVISLETDDGEIFILEDACLCKAEDIAIFLEDWRSYDQELQSVMQIMKEVLWKKEEQHG